MVQQENFDSIFNKKVGISSVVLQQKFHNRKMMAIIH